MGIKRAHFHGFAGLGLVAGALVLVSVLVIDVPRAGDPAVLRSVGGPDILGKVEVRERQVDPLDGRTARFPEAAPGLTNDADQTADSVRSYDPAQMTEGLLAESALELIEYSWQDRLPGWIIRFESAEAGVRGLTFSRERVIEVYVRPSDTAADLARVVAHELGHAVDLTHNTEDHRQLWRDARALDPDVPWWPESGAADFETGAGDFAECFATWLVGSETLSQVGGSCSEEDLLLVAALG